MSSRLWKNGVVVLLFVGILLASLLVISSKPTVLGLDLQGGVELNLRANPTPQVQKIESADMDSAVDIIRRGCDNLGLSEVEVSRLGADQISVSIPGARGLDQATECATKPARLFFYNWQDNLLGPAQSALASTADQRQKWISRDRLPTEGINQQWIAEGAEPTLWDAVKLASKQQPRADCSDCALGDKYYLFAANKTPLSGPVTSKSDLYFDQGGRPINPANTIVKKVPQGTLVVEERGSGDTGSAFFVLQDRSALDGSQIKRPQQETEPGSNRPNVTFSFTDSGRRAFQEITRDISQDARARAPVGALGAEQAAPLSGSFAVVLDGQVITRPIINFVENPDGIDGRTGAQISGDFSVQEAQELASYLQRGALPVELVLISQSQVSATLGQTALDQSVMALAFGLLLVIGFLLFFYRFLGALAALALLSYGTIFFALVKLIPITLTLPGIAGLVLTIGVAADSNIVIFERIKEELRAGRGMKRAISVGYKRGISTIIDANVVTLLTAFVLFILATSGIKGFAFMLGVGTIVSLFSAVVLTRSLLVLSENKISNSRFFVSSGRETRLFDFAGRARWLFAISGAVLVLAAGAISINGLSFGIDFSSGSKIEFALKESPTVPEIRAELSRIGVADAEIQEVTNPALGENSFQLQSATLPPEKIAEIRSLLNQEFSLSQQAGAGETGEAFSSISVGPTFGESIISSALLAMIFSLLLVCGYLALRFQAQYIAPVLIAIMHDILIALGVYALFGFEISSATVAAFLTILGYSLYDTIIVFDRIRENEKKMPGATYSQIINQSTSEVLVRSLITTLSTLLPVAALLIFGGETLQSFAVAILVGLLSGAYSSLFIASPVLAFIKEREEKYQRRRRRQEEQGSVPVFYRGEG